MRPRIPALLAPLFALLCWGASAHASDYLTISTGALTGVYYPVGGALCRLLNEQSGPEGLRCSVQSTKGSLANLQDLQAGKSQLALVQSDVLHHAVHGTGPFASQGPNRALRSLYRLHHESVALLVGEQSRIGSLGDLPGKRVDLGSVNGGDRVTIMALIEAMGWQAGDFAPTAGLGADRLQGLCDGSLDAAFVVAGQPNQVISDLIGRCKARLLPIEDARITGLIEGSTYYERGRIPANLYPGQTLAIPTLGVRADLVTLDTLPVETVHRLRRVMDEHLKQFTRLHPALITLTPEAMTAPSPAPPHAAMQQDPGAPAPEPTPDAPALMPESLQPGSAPSQALPTQAPSDATATDATEGETAPAKAPSDATATDATSEERTAPTQAPSGAADTGSVAAPEGERAPTQVPSGATATSEERTAPTQVPSGAAATGSAAAPEGERAPTQVPSGATATEPVATP